MDTGGSSAKGIKVGIATECTARGKTSVGRSAGLATEVTSITADGDGVTGRDVSAADRVWTGVEVIIGAAICSVITEVGVGGGAGVGELVFSSAGVSAGISVDGRDIAGCDSPSPLSRPGESGAGAGALPPVSGVIVGMVGASPWGQGKAHAQGVKHSTTVTTTATKITSHRVRMITLSCLISGKPAPGIGQSEGPIRRSRHFLQNGPRWADSG